MIRTLLVYDTPGWACESDCKALAKHLEFNAPGAFDITLRQASTANERDLASFDLVMSAIYYHLTEAAHPRSISMVSSYSYWIRKSWEGGWPHLREWKRMVAHNKHIMEKLSPEDHGDITLLYHMFDQDMWTPGKRSCNTEGPFRVGYAGHKNQPLKGVDLIRSAVEGIPGCEFCAPTWEEGRIPHSKMPDFYRSLNVYVCMSRPGDDAGPRPPIEAGLCGVPVITTAAGQIGEMVQHEKNGLIVERSVEALKQAIVRLKGDGVLRRRLQEAVRESFLQRWVLDVGRSWTSFMLATARL
jgi:hypothetical protein